MTRQRRHGLRALPLTALALAVTVATTVPLRSWAQVDDATAPAQPAAAAAQSPQASLLKKVDVEQKIGTKLPLDLHFRDSEGHDVRLGDLFGKRPVILTMVYYECPMLCTLVLNGVVRAIRALPFEVGKGFDIVTVSFDPKEGPELAARKKKAYLEHYRHPEAADSWHFLTGDQAAIKRLTDAVGFHYAYDAERDQYAHAAAIMVTTPDGTLARYFFGVEYAPRDLKLALVEASSGKLGNVIDQLILYCYHYDPSTGRYSAVVMNMVRVGGAATVLAMGLFVVIMRRREKSEHRRKA
jgi:protein SCO1/2